MKHILIVQILLISIIYCTYPIAIFHGIGDGCDWKNTTLLTNLLKKDLKTHVECIEIGNGFWTSILENFENQAKIGCENLKKNPHFQNKFHILGISQGTLLGRYIIEKCDIKGEVVNYLSFDGPQQGIGQLPKLYCGKFCDFLNFITVDLIYNDFIVKHMGPSSYYKFRWNQKLYNNKNLFLKDLNNEGEIKNEEYKKRMLKLNKIMLIKGKRDTVITPRESSWFEFYDKEGKEIVKLEDSDFYQKDFIGLKKLNEDGKIIFVEFENEHVLFTMEEYDIYIKNFFLDDGDINY